MEQLCRFGPVWVRFRELPHYPNWPFWSWKLDSFQAEGRLPDVTVGYEPGSLAPKGPPVWTDGDAGREIYLQEDGTLLWQHKEPVSGRLLLQFTVCRRIILVYACADKGNCVCIFL